MIGAGNTRRERQYGQAILALLLLLGIALSVFVYNAVDPSRAAVRREARTQVALVEAKEALIGRAAADASRPGSLPCPDFDDGSMNPINVANDGVADVMVGNNCPSYIGRLPWRTLGLPDLRDDSGERLWYALSRTFRDHSAAGPLNSDTKGDITVYRDGTTTANVMTNEAVAVVFSAGAPLAGQVRDAANANNPANYLDTAFSINNATPTANPPIAPLPSLIVVSAPSSYNPPVTFNDRALVVTTADLIPVVEMRVARELINTLRDYKLATAALGCNSPSSPPGSGCYPWADINNGCSDAPPYDPNTSNRNRIPALGAAPYRWGTAAGSPISPCNLSPNPNPTPSGVSLPAWFVPNAWRSVIYYSAARDYVGPESCDTCVGSMLTVDGLPNKEVVILMPGPAGSGRPTGLPFFDPNYWLAYFEDAENLNISTVPPGPNDTYITPLSNAYTRDRIFTIP